MKDYLFYFFAAYEGISTYASSKAYIEADTLKAAWIKAAEQAVMQFGNSLDHIELVTIIEK